LDFNDGASMQLAHQITHLTVSADKASYSKQAFDEINSCLEVTEY